MPLDGRRGVGVPRGDQLLTNISGCRAVLSCLALHKPLLCPVHQTRADRTTKGETRRLHSRHVVPAHLTLQRRTRFLMSPFHSIPFHSSSIPVHIHPFLLDARRRVDVRCRAIESVCPCLAPACRHASFGFFVSRMCRGSSLACIMLCSFPFHSSSIPFQLSFRSTRPMPHLPVLPRAGRKRRGGGRIARHTGGRYHVRF